MNYHPVALLKAQLRKENIDYIREYISKHPVLIRRIFREITISDANKAAYDLFETRNQSRLLVNLRNTFTATSDLSAEQVIALLNGESDFSGEFQYKPRDNKLKDIFLRVVAVGPAAAPFSRIIIALQDITTWKKIERQLRKRAQLDSLTNLLNHSTVMHSLEQELIRAKRYGLNLSCMMVDLDFFKVVNDKFGHQRGDQILKRVSMMIKNCFRRVDVVGRYGGDEFLVILPETRPSQAKCAALRLQKIFASTLFNYKKLISFRITLSIGIAGYPGKKIKDAKDLVALSDKAMYACKMAGRNRIEII